MQLLAVDLLRCLGTVSIVEIFKKCVLNPVLLKFKHQY